MYEAFQEGKAMHCLRDADDLVALMNENGYVLIWVRDKDKEIWDEDGPLYLR